MSVDDQDIPHNQYLEDNRFPMSTDTRVLREASPHQPLNGDQGVAWANAYNASVDAAKIQAKSLLERARRPDSGEIER